MAENSFLLRCGEINLPSPVSMSVDDEIIWTSDTGRTLDGRMMGEVVAEKKNIKVGWEWLTEQEAAQIRNLLFAGFFSMTFRDYGEVLTIENYRGTISKEVAGCIGDGNFYYKKVSVTIIQR